MAVSEAEKNRIAKAARADAEKALAEQLGCTPQEAKQALDAMRAADDAKKSDTQRALDAAKSAQTAAERAQAEAAAERLAAKVERKLHAAGVGAGLDPEKQAAAIARAARMVTVPVDADDQTITAEVESLKADVPGLFAPGTPASRL